jgi:kynurenine formamidase
MSTPATTQNGPDGSLAQLTGESIAKALGQVQQGKVYSLESQWWRGMPGHPVHPRFEVLTYRTPGGEQIQKDQEYLNEPANTINYGFVSELIMGTAHTGTHIDAFCHVTCGPEAEWYGGHSAHKELGDFGALNGDAAALPPIISRGVMLDIPKALGIEHCPPEYPVSGEDMQKAVDGQGIEVLPGDTILVRTGTMKFWPDQDAMQAAANAGVSMSGSEWLLEHSPVAVAADNVAFECAPSGVEGSPQPVHVHLVQQNGIPILEWVNCEELAQDGVYEFTFICLPLSVIGATGSMVRPVAIV